MELSDHLNAKLLSLTHNLWVLSTWNCTWHGTELPVHSKPPLSTRKAVCSFLSKTHISPPPITLSVTEGSSPSGAVTPILVLNVSCWQQRSGCCNPGEHGQVSPTWEGDGGCRGLTHCRDPTAVPCPLSCPCQCLLCGVGPHHPSWLTDPPAEQPLLNMCQREILTDKRACRLLRVTSERGLALSGQGWALREAVSMGSRNPALLVAVPLH